MKLIGLFVLECIGSSSCSDKGAFVGITDGIFAGFKKRPLEVVILLLYKINLGQRVSGNSVVRYLDPYPIGQLGQTF